MSQRAFFLVFLAALGVPWRANGAMGRRPRSIPVVVLTRGGLHVGRDLRYQDGVFVLRAKTGDVRIPEADVARISFVSDASGPRQGIENALGLAIRLMVHERTGRELGRALPRDVFFLRDQPIEESFRRAAGKVREPPLAAALCCDLAAQCVAAKTPRVALTLMREAEREAKPKAPVLGFVYGLMQAAALAGSEAPGEARDAMKRLVDEYPAHASLIREFGEKLRKRDGRPWSRFPGRRPGRRPEPPPP